MRSVQHNLFGMRYVVRHKKTGCFLSSAGEWTQLLRDAQRFPNELSLGLHLENAHFRLGDEAQIVEVAPV